MKQKLVFDSIDGLSYSARGVRVPGRRAGGDAAGRAERTRKDNGVSDRREFLKGAGVLGLASWTAALPGTAASEATDAGRKPQAGADGKDVVLENAEMRLVIRANGVARSLIHKPTGQECLAADSDEPMFALTQDRPYDNELQLAYPAEKTHFPAKQVTYENGALTVEFDLVGYAATIPVTITDSYIAFRLEKLTYHGYTPLQVKSKTDVDGLDAAATAGAGAQELWAVAERDVG